MDGFLEEIRAAFPELGSIELIGSGKMTQVFKVYDRSLQRYEVLKTVRHAGTDAPFLSRFEGEAGRLSQLGHHQGIVIVYGTGRCKTFSYIRMEHMEGGDLHAALESGAITPRAALRLLAGVLTALQHVHAKGTVHRDIKPANILLTAGYGKAKLGDFGIAKSVGAPSMTNYGQLLGTEGYIAPEVLADPSSASSLSDIFSVGQVIKWMLNAAGRQKTAVSKGLSLIADRATAYDRGQRFQSVRELAEAYHKQLDGRPFPVRKPILLFLAACLMGTLFYGGYHWYAGAGEMVELQSQNAGGAAPPATDAEVISQTETETAETGPGDGNGMDSPAGNPAPVLVATTEDAPKPEIKRGRMEDDVRIQDRLQDYDGKLKGDFLEQLAKWDAKFNSDRAPAVKEAGRRIISAANRIRDSRRIDATQLKSDPEFKALVDREMKGALNVEALRTELKEWSTETEGQTKKRLIESLQNVVAEDLGLMFDENLRGVVEKAVREIPLEKLVEDVGSVAEMEATLLAVMPEAAISENTRGWIKEIAVQLTKFVAEILAGGEGAGFVGMAAGLTADPLLERGVWLINEMLTPDPDPKAIEDTIALALRNWNKKNLDTRLETILTDYRHTNMRALGVKAVELSNIFP